MFAALIDFQVVIGGVVLLGAIGGVMGLLDRFLG